MVNDIIIWRNVVWSGSLASKYSLYEFVFKRFVMNLKEIDKDTVSLKVSRNDNDFIMSRRVRYNHKLAKEVVYPVSKKLVFEVVLKFNWKHLLVREYYFVFEDKEPMLLSFVFVCDNVLMFQQAGYIYILPNDVDLEDWYEAVKEDGLDKKIRGIFYQNGFDFAVRA